MHIQPPAYTRFALDLSQPNGPFVGELFRSGEVAA